MSLMRSLVLLLLIILYGRVQSEGLNTNVSVFEFGLIGPQDVFVDINGIIFVADSFLGIVRIANGNVSIVGPNAAEWGFSPYRICGDKSGLLYVSNGLPGPTSYSLTTDGSIVAQQNHTALNVEIRDMAVHPITGVLYLMTASDKIYSSNSHLTSFSRVASHWTFIQLFSMCFHPTTGLLYISDEWGPFIYSVDVFTGVVIHLSGIYNNQPGETPALSVQLGSHSSVAVDNSGLIFFGSMVSHNVVCIDSRGNIFELYDELEMNTNIALSSDGVLYIPQYYKATLVTIRFKANYLNTLFTSGPSASPILRPTYQPFVIPPYTPPENNWNIGAQASFYWQLFVSFFFDFLFFWFPLCFGCCLCLRRLFCPSNSRQARNLQPAQNTRSPRREVAPSSIEMVAYAQVQQLDDSMMSDNQVEYVEVEAFTV